MSYEVEPLMIFRDYALYVLYLKFAHLGFSPWGYLVRAPDQSEAVFSDKVQALQFIDAQLREEPSVALAVSAEERILQEDMLSSPSTSSLL